MYIFAAVVVLAAIIVVGWAFALDKVVLDALARRRPRPALSGAWSPQELAAVEAEVFEPVASVIARIDRELAPAPAPRGSAFVDDALAAALERMKADGYRSTPPVPMVPAPRSVTANPYPLPAPELTKVVGTIRYGATGATDPVFGSGYCSVATAPGDTFRPACDGCMWIAENSSHTRGVHYRRASVCPAHAPVPTRPSPAREPEGR